MVHVYWSGPEEDCRLLERLLFWQIFESDPKDPASLICLHLLYADITVMILLAPSLASGRQQDLDFC